MCFHVSHQFFWNINIENEDLFVGQEFESEIALLIGLQWKF